MGGVIFMLLMICSDRRAVFPAFPFILIFKLKVYKKSAQKLAYMAFARIFCLHVD